MDGDRIPINRQDDVIQVVINSLTESRRIHEEQQRFHTEQQRVNAHHVEVLDQQINELRKLDEKRLICIDCGKERIEQICHKCTRNYQQRRVQTVRRQRNQIQNQNPIQQPPRRNRVRNQNQNAAR